MFELLYTSVATKALLESELVDILTKAQIKNQQLGITGMLVYHDREIMQLLEGDEQQVKTLFQTICYDKRHTSIEVFYQGTIEERAFSNWSMAFSLLNQETLSFLTELNKDGYQELDRQSSPLHMLKGSPNRGKKFFLSLRETL